MSEPYFKGPLVELPAGSTDTNLGVTINPNNEPQVDLRAGTDSAVTLTAWVNPGRDVGDELFLRLIRRTGAVSGGVDTGNKATIHLKVLTPETRMQYLDYPGFSASATFFTFPPFPGSPYPGGKPQTAIFRWNGGQWLQVFADLAS